MAEFVIPAISLALVISNKLQAIRGDTAASIPDVDETIDFLRGILAALEDIGIEIDIDTCTNQAKLLQNDVRTAENMAYDIEDALTDYLQHLPVGRGRIHGIMKELALYVPRFGVQTASSRLSSRMDSIKKQKDICDQLQARLQSSNFTTTPTDHWPHQSSLASGGAIVGFETRNGKLIEQLNVPTIDSAILIAGPGGSGKSTMVFHTYLSSSTGQGPQGFDCHVWLHVPDMTLELYQTDVNPQHVEMNIITVEELRELLERKKFLLVLDNVCREVDVIKINTLIPAERLPESKIIITSRWSDERSMSSSCIQDFTSGLSKADAVILLRNHVEFLESCPHLNNEAEAILNKCDGMPLAIKTIGDLLASKSSKVPSVWNTVCKTLGSEICKGANSVLFKNLQPSYRELQRVDKICFLYFSMFPNSHSSISRKRLIRLWVAEGFVATGIKDPREAEVIAENILDDLVKRNLVVAETMKEDVHGRRVRRYRVLHLVQEINILRRENFLTILDSNSNCDNLARDKIRRLSVDKGALKLIDGRTDVVRTLLVFELESISSIPLLRKILKTCKFLRVLDLQGLTALKKFPPEVIGLTLLKYLSLKKTQIGKVPKSIKKLIDLETLDLRETNLTSLPSKIWHLTKLRHLLVSGNAGVGIVLFIGNRGLTSTLLTLSCIQAGRNKTFLAALGELKSLKKLELRDLQEEDGELLCSSLRKMKALSTLDVRATSENINLKVDHMPSPDDLPIYLRHLYLAGKLGEIPRWIPELTSLKKIGLKWSKVTDARNPLACLQDLPCLEELDLVDYCTGQELVFETDKFKELSKLRIEEFSQLKSVTIEVMALPKLKEITMRLCLQLTNLTIGTEALPLIEKVKSRGMDARFNSTLRDLYNNSPEKLDIA